MKYKINGTSVHQHWNPLGYGIDVVNQPPVFDHLNILETCLEVDHLP